MKSNDGTRTSDYFVKPGYIHNLDATSFDGDTPGVEFWTPVRLAAALQYQYDVYRLAGQIASRHHLARIADVGCGPALKTRKFLAGQASHISLFDQESIKTIALEQIPDAEFTALDLEDCTFRGEHNFGMVICSDVLEHLRNPVRCIELCKSLVSKEGFIIFSTPERDWLRGKDCFESGHPQHVREWNASEFTELLRSRDLSVVEERLLPPKKLSFWAATARLLTFNLPGIRSWRSCQVKVCRL